ncbi:hypothetical protein BKI52_09875 [marine bacterium AO1-C]|nr:hypothetical protein BKI52_09875 [marine bacterium AO1-C]
MLRENDATMTNKYQHILVIDGENEHLTTTLKEETLGKATVVQENSVWLGLQYLEKLHSKSDFPDLLLLSWENLSKDTERFLKIYQATFYPRHRNTRIILVSKESQLLQLKRNLGYSFIKTILPKPLPTNLLQQALLVA